MTWCYHRCAECSGLRRENFHFPHCRTEHYELRKGILVWRSAGIHVQFGADGSIRDLIAMIRKGRHMNISVPSRQRSPYVIHIARRREGRGACKNEAEILPKLEALGFKSVKLAELPDIGPTERFVWCRSVLWHLTGTCWAIEHCSSTKGHYRVVELHSPFGWNRSLCADFTGHGIQLRLRGAGAPRIQEQRTLLDSVGKTPWSRKYGPGSAVRSHLRSVDMIHLPPRSNLLPSSTDFAIGWQGGPQYCAWHHSHRERRVPPYLNGNAIMHHRA